MIFLGTVHKGVSQTDPVYVFVTNFESTCLNIEHVFTDSAGNLQKSLSGSVEPFESMCIKEVHMLAGGRDSKLFLRKSKTDGTSEIDVISTLFFVVPPICI